MGILMWLLGISLDRPGVYRIRNRRNNMVYIGSTERTIRIRLLEHVSCLDGGTHPNTRLQTDWDKYKQKAFAFEIIENTEVSQVRERELYWQLRVSPSKLYAQLAQPPSVREQRKKDHEQRRSNMIDLLLAASWNDSDLYRVFKAPFAAEVIERRRTRSI